MNKYYIYFRCIPAQAGVFSYKNLQKPIDRKTKICYNRVKIKEASDIKYKLDDS